MNSFEFRALSRCLDEKLIDKYAVYSKVWRTYFNMSSIETDDFKSFNDFEKNGSNFKFNFNINKNIIIGSYETNLLSECNDFHRYLRDLSELYCCDVPHVCYKYNHTQAARNKRLEKRVQLMFFADSKETPLKFVTFTFEKVPDEEYIKDYRVKIVRLLKETCFDYVSNEDYGFHTDRFHYHAICLLKTPTSEEDIITKWKDIGFTYFEAVETKNDKALSLYVNKLVNHAIKTTNKRQAIMYCRSAKQFYLDTLGICL